MIVAAPSYLERCGEPHSIADPEGHNRLGFGSARAVDGWPLRQKGETIFVPAIGRVQASDGEGLRHLALAGTGLARLAAFTVRKDIAAGVWFRSSITSTPARRRHSCRLCRPRRPTAIPRQGTARLPCAERQSELISMFVSAARWLMLRSIELMTRASSAISQTSRRRRRSDLASPDYSSALPGSAAASASIAKRTRSGRCGVAGHSAWERNTRRGVFSSKGTSAPVRTRSRINQHGNQASP